MNTKLLPATLSLVAGLITCILSFVQHVDIVVFAERFIIASIVFYIIGLVISIIINTNFKKEPEKTDETEETDVSDEEVEASDEEAEATEEDA